MYTQCQYCQTIFRVRAEQLRIAQGQVRCSCCNQTFNAVKNLRESPHPEEEEEWPESLLITPVIPSHQSSPFTRKSPDIEFEVTTQLLNETEEEFEDEDEDNRAEPVEESSTSEQYDDDLPTDYIEEIELNDEEPADPLPFDLPKNLKPIEPSSRTELSLEELAEGAEQPGHRGLIWSIGAVLLLVTLIGQLTWFKRHEMIHHPEGRILVELLCTWADCQLPPRRAPKMIKVVNRSISLHPEVSNALQIKLTFANQADFIQPYPVLQISLFDKDERLVVQRRFRPTEYLSRPLDQGEVLQPSEAVIVTMAFEDPGKGVTGFKLEFF